MEGGCQAVTVSLIRTKPHSYIILIHWLPWLPEHAGSGGFGDMNPLERWRLLSGAATSVQARVRAEGVKHIM